jgi:hypothetical protein
MRGAIVWNSNPTYFLAEWFYTIVTDGSQGVMIYQGNPTIENGKQVVYGTRTQLKSDGSVVTKSAFKATRLP